MSGSLDSKPHTTWQLLRIYWSSKQRFSAFLFLFSVLALTIVVVLFDVLFTTWYNDFYNALQDYKARDAIDLLIIFVFLAAIYIIVQVYRYYLQSYLALRWRKWLTQQFLNKWLQNRNYYLLEEFNETTDNPDQRIQEDINSFTIVSLGLLTGILNAVTSVFAFIYILWLLSGPLTLSLGSFGTLYIPGYLVWVTIIYATIGTIITFKIGRPLVGLNFEQQRREANFRFASIDLRSHAEHVALYKGEKHQKRIIERIFGGVLENYYMIILRQKLLLWFTAGYQQTSLILPFAFALPNYFNKVFKLGGLMQTLSAFRQIQDALSFLVNSYTVIAEWRAIVKRLLTFIDSMEKATEMAKDQNNFILHEDSSDIISTKRTHIYTPDLKPLLNNVDLEFHPGKNYWLKGPSGIGKSTYVRVLAGIWPFGEGIITVPKHKKVLFIPQRTYMPLGSLREALIFPNTIHPTDEELINALIACDLPKLTAKLDKVGQWSEQLSPGELQRIAFVRILLQKPDWVILDESTSALDLPHENHLYELLAQQLPECTLISVGHRPSLEKYHNEVIDFTRYSVVET